MAGRFSTRRVAAPELVPAARYGARGAVRTVSRAGSRARRACRRQSAADRQAPRRQGAPASPADRGDQSVGAGKAAGRGNPRPHPATGVAIRPGRAAGAQHPGTQRFRIGNSRRDDGPRSARAAAQGSDAVNDILINGHECVYVERRHARADRRALQGRGASSAHHQQDRRRRSAAASTNRIRCATRACSTARASTSRCGRWRSTDR